MVKIASSIVLCALVVFLSPYAAAIDWKHDLRQGVAEAESSGKPVMVDFYTDWCGWCKKLDAETYGDPEVDRMAGSFVSVKVDGDKDRQSLLKYGVRGFPTIVFLDKRGEVLDKVVGYLGPKDMASRMSKILSKYPSSSGQARSVAVKPTQTAQSEAGTFNLGGIIMNGKSPRAIINDVVVKIGDVIGGAKVTEIRNNKVKLLSNGKEICLEM